MNSRKKWILSVFASGGVLLLNLFALLLNPGVLYAHQTTTRQYTIYHNQPLDPVLVQRVAQARHLDQASEMFAKNLRLEICLNDGSWYPRLVQTVWSPAFAWSFHNKVVLNGEVNAIANRLTFRTYTLNLTALLAHEMTHCYQFHHQGLWRSNPLARYPAWKWEGYAEYIARHPGSLQALRENLSCLQQAEQAEPTRWDLRLADSSSTSREYFTYFVLTEYCLDVKHLTFQQLLQDTTSQEVTRQQLLAWAQSHSATVTKKDDQVILAEELRVQ
ncbi:MAG: hypothetical protein EOO60_09320 [Hymenobacter sp.]|nr:MAG: hypothetical protein EOO60_09320 [Hymenobacter sp.]